MSVGPGVFKREVYIYIYIYKVLYTFYRRVLYLFLFDTVRAPPGRAAAGSQVGALPSAPWCARGPADALGRAAAPPPGAGVTSCFPSPIMTVTVTFNTWTFISEEGGRGFRPESSAGTCLPRPGTPAPASALSNSISIFIFVLLPPRRKLLRRPSRGRSPWACPAHSHA